MPNWAVSARLRPARLRPASASNCSGGSRLPGRFSRKTEGWGLFMADTVCWTLGRGSVMAAVNQPLRLALAARNALRADQAQPDANADRVLDRVCDASAQRLERAHLVAEHLGRDLDLD